MNIIVKIEGREAIPVRAIPLLTDWQGMTPDELARGLAWDEETPRSHRLSAFYVSGDGKVRAFSARWWETWVYRSLKAQSDRIKKEQVSHEDGHEKWRRDSLTVFPSGSFVWKDEFEKFYASRIGQFGSIFISPTQHVEMSACEKKRRLGLDFSPSIPDPTTWQAVMEGFNSDMPSVYSPTASACTLLPTETETTEQSCAPEAIRNGGYKQPEKLWTEEFKAEVRAFHAVNGLKKTAEYYQRAQGTITRHISLGKNKKKPFGHGLGSNK